MLRILSLDCETTDVTPESGQIIEIGAIIAEIDEVTLEIKAKKEFQSLVKLRMEMGERITRITGIDQDLLALEGLSQNQAQENWFHWLEGEKIDLILGHSIDFDLNFLNQENWFLPEAEIIDTLEMAKIILPNYSAVNLEFLQKKLNLETFSKTNFNLSLNHNESAHRALFDSKIALSLFKNLLDKLSSISFTDKFYENLNSFLPQLKITFFSKKTDHHFEDEINNSPEEILVKLDGQIQTLNPNEKLNKLTPSSAQKAIKNLEKLEVKNLPRGLKQIFLQVHSSLILKQFNSNLILKIHVFGGQQIQFLNLLMEQIFKAKNDSENLLQPKNLNNLKIYKTEIIENLISRASEIFNQKVDPTKIIILTEIYKQIETNLDKETEENIQKLISRFDFTMIILEPFWFQNLIDMSKQKTTPELIQAKQKLRLFIQEISEFNFQNLPESNFFSSKIKQKIIQNQQEIKQKFNEFLNTNLIDKITLRKSYNSFSVPFPIFNSPQEVVLNLIQKYPNLVWQTNLKKNDLEGFLRLAGLADIFQKMQIQIQPLEEIQYLQTREIQDFKELIGERLDSSKLNQKVSLIAFSRNANFEKAKDYVAEKFSPDEYLVPGESGSLTKVISKAKNKFHPLVLLKSKEIVYFLKNYNQAQNLPEVDVWIVEKPAFWINQYWFERAKNYPDSKQFLEALKTLNLKSMSADIYKQTQKVVNLANF